MKYIITLAVLLISLNIKAQVGINNNSPKATLDITAKTTDGSKPEGLIAPRLTGDQLQAGDVQYGTAQKGAIVYATTAATLPSTKTANITSEGYYFFDGTAWQKITGGASAGDTTNDAWINDTTSSVVKLGTKSDGTARTTGTDFVARDNGSVGIGTSIPDASAVLEVSSSNKGILIPRVALTGITDVTTIPSPINGLMVYNTGTGSLTYKGFVFWNGTEWRSIDNKSTVSPVITSLNCTDSSSFPTTFISGVPYSGTLTIPYIGGNGGSYDIGSSFTQNGLTFTLNAGTLNYGNGTISYSISGTPNFTSPNTISVPISFLGQNCNVIVGENVSVSPIQYLKKVISPIPITNDATVQSATTTTFGNLSVRYGGLVSNVANTVNSIQLSPSITTQMTVWGQLTGGGLPTGISSRYSAFTSVANTWTGWGNTFNPTLRDYGIIYVTLHATGEIYRITMLCNDNMTSPTVNSNITFFIEKL